jgi:hypothetical protein
MSRLRLHQINPGALAEGSYTLKIVGGVVELAAWDGGLDAGVVTVVNGVPMLMFDADSTPVTTEVPS